MIIVIKKADLDVQPFSGLKEACAAYKFELAYNTLIRKKDYPIVLNEFIIHKKELIKTKKKSYNRP